MEFYRKLHLCNAAGMRLHGSWNSDGAPWRRNARWQVRDDLLPDLYGQRDGCQGQTSLFVSVVLRSQNSIPKMDGNCTFRCPFPLFHLGLPGLGNVRPTKRACPWI
jgi:hypothetical protein